MAFRPKILALANKITLEARTGIPNVPGDPEYRILAEVVTDEQADVALACKVRHSLTLDEIAKRCGKPPEVTKKLLWELANEGVVVTYTSPDDGRDYYTLPCWVPGIMEMMVGNKEQVEAHPEIARCFDEYTLKNMKLMTPNLPRGMGVMRVIPVQKAIDLNRHAVSSDQLSKYIDNAWKIAVTACSCRRTRRIMGEGCGHLEEDMCIMLNKAADFHVKTGHGREISKEEAYALNAGEGSKFREKVGLETPDDYTVVYTCLSPKPYFDSLGAYACLYPASQALIDELGGPDGFKSMNNENMWYNGCYTMTSYIQGNEKTYTKNPLYWDTECKLFDSVIFKMIESSEIGYQLYENGEVDHCGLTESQLNTIAKDPNHKFYDYLVPATPNKYSYQFHFNFNKKNEDGTPDKNWNTAIANEAFRKSMYYGLDLVDYWKRSNAIDPMSCENNFYTMKGLVYTSDGTDYTELVRQEMGLPEANGETMVRLDAEKAAAYKQQAIEELTALGVTFPVTIDYFISGSNQNALDSANVLKQVFSNSLGDDYVQLNIKTYVSSLRKEVTQAHRHSFILNGWGADYGDPQNYLGQQRYGYDNAYYCTTYNYVNDLTEETPANKDLLATYKEFAKMVDEADAITDNMDERYKAFAKAEAYFLQHALTIPCNYGIGWCLTKIDNDSKVQAQYGIQNEKMKNWETNTEGYTSEEKGVAKQIAEFAATKE